MSGVFSDMISLSLPIFIPRELNCSISSSNFHGSKTTPFPITTILFSLMIPEGKSESLKILSPTTNV